MDSPVSARSVKSGAKSPSRTMPATLQRRAVGVIRVSRVGDRGGESFASPGEQAERIKGACERDGLELVKGESFAPRRERAGAPEPP